MYCIWKMCDLLKYEVVKLLVLWKPHVCKVVCHHMQFYWLWGSLKIETYLAFYHLKWTTYKNIKINNIFSQQTCSVFIEKVFEILLPKWLAQSITMSHESIFFS